MNDVLDDLRAAADYQIRMSGSASDYLLEAENEIKRLRAENERLRAEKEALYASIVGIERAAAGAIYSQESIHAMALYALKSLEVKP